MKSFLILIILSIAVAIGAGVVGHERNRDFVEKSLMAAVDSSGIIQGDQDGVSVRYDHFTVVVSGTVGSKNEKETLLSRLREAIGTGRVEDKLVVPAIEPVAVAPVSAAVPATPAAPAPLAEFRLEKAGDLVLVLAGVVPSEEVKSNFFTAAQRLAPELVTVENRLRVDAAVGSPAWIEGAPDLISRLVGSVQSPRMVIDRASAMVGGASDDRVALEEIRGEFNTLFGGFSTRRDELVYDEARPAPAIRLPLVFYMGPWEGKVLFEGSIPTAPQLKEIESAAAGAAGDTKIVSRLRVSPQTVNESWLPELPALVTALIEAGGDKVELVIVDGSLTISGTISDKVKKEAMTGLLEPVRAAGYRIVDELIVKP